jgi:hypothetical protein
MRRMTAQQYREQAAEHDMQAALVEHLRLNAAGASFWFAIPNAGRRSPKVRALMKAEGLTAGVADLCIMLSGGRTLWLELKTRRGRQSRAQKAFAAVCDILDHAYLVPRSLDEAIAILRAYGALK